MLPLHGARVLIVEDEPLIAFDVEQLCLDYGAVDVVIAQNLTILTALDIAEFDIAILDLRIADQSSTGFARRLFEFGLPFIFTSGDPENPEMVGEFPGIPIVGKPYASSVLLYAIDAAIAKQQPIADNA